MSKSLKLGYADSSLLVYIDDLLQWFSISISQEADEFAANLIAEYGEDDYKIKFENLLDRLLLDSNTRELGPFDSSVPRDTAKWRYRKLMSIFHPDKGANAMEWLNFRAEKINTYYSDYKVQCLKPERQSINSINRSEKKHRRKYSERRTSMSIDSRGRVPVHRDWRDKFGDPKVLERRIMIVSICGVIVFMVLLTSSIFLYP